MDLMLSRSTRRHNSDSITHLVAVELKAPKVKVNTEEISQIEGYAASVMDDQEVSQRQCVVGVLGNQRRCRPAREVPHDRRVGLDPQEGQRLHLREDLGPGVGGEQKPHEVLSERLEYQADKGDSLKHLQEHYAKYLEGVF